MKATDAVIAARARAVADEYRMQYAQLLEQIENHPLGNLLAQLRETLADFNDKVTQAKFTCEHLRAVKAVCADGDVPDEYFEHRIMIGGDFARRLAALELRPEASEHIMILSKGR